MKKPIKYSLIVCVTLALLVVNMIPVFLFRDRARVTSYASVAILLLLLHTARTVSACFLKHKGNMFLIRGKYAHIHIYSPDREETFTPAYEREFRVLLLVHCMAIPFYIPLIFFVHSWENTLWDLLLFFLPPLIAVANEMRKMYAAAKKAKQRDAALEHERIEQERREEEGHWK